MKSGNLNFLEPSGSLQACNGTALPFSGLGNWYGCYLVWETRFKCWKHAKVCNLSACTSGEESGRMTAIWFQLQNTFWKYFSQPNAWGWRSFLLEVLQFGGYLLFRVECCLGLIQSTGLQFCYSDRGTKKHRKIPAEILTELFPNTIQMCYCLRQFSWCERLQKIIFQSETIKEYATVKMQVFWGIILCDDKYLPSVRI